MWCWHNIILLLFPCYFMYEVFNKGLSQIWKWTGLKKWEVLWRQATYKSCMDQIKLIRRCTSSMKNSTIYSAIFRIFWVKKKHNHVNHSPSPKKGYRLMQQAQICEAYNAGKEKGKNMWRREARRWRTCGKLPQGMNWNS